MLIGASITYVNLTNGQINANVGVCVCVCVYESLI